MDGELLILLISAGSIGLIHTATGPDHYLPFIVLNRSRKWSGVKTLWITFACGLGHVLSSVFIGIIGISFGVVLKKLEIIESFRGELATWLLIAFGLAYMIWGLKKSYKGKSHTHLHGHGDGTVHAHRQFHEHEHSHVPKDNVTIGKITPWALFIVFVLGPCEPLIPLLMYPASQNSMFNMVMVVTVFSLVTIITMILIVWLGIRGFSWIRISFLERHVHAISGAVIALSGIGVIFLGF